MKIADFLWPRSREPVLRVPVGSQPGLRERSGNGPLPESCRFRLLSGFGRNSADYTPPPPLSASSHSRDPCVALPLYSRSNLFSIINRSARGKGPPVRPIRLRNKIPGGQWSRPDGVVLASWPTASMQLKRQIVEQSPLMERDHDLAIAEQRSKLGDMDCERRLNIPHSAVIPPSTNSRAPVT